MLALLYTVHVLVCIFLILVVLLQQGKGADLSVFGGGGTMTAFGARGAATVLHKLTVASFISFILLTIAIGVVQGKQGQSSVLSGVSTSEAAATASSDDSIAAPAEETEGELTAEGEAVLPEAENFEPVAEGEEPAPAVDDPANDNPANPEGNSP